MDTIFIRYSALNLTSFPFSTDTTFEKCELDLSYIEPGANGLATNVHFITGVMKIQAGIEYEKKMTHREKQACKCLLREGVVDDSDDDSDEDSDTEMNFAHALKKNNKRKRDESESVSKYINCRFILGSAAIVESLWSEQDNLLANKRRRGTTPRVVEAMLFLKKNADLWDIRDVNQANEDRKQEKQDERYQKKLEQDAELVSFMASLSV